MDLEIVRGNAADVIPELISLVELHPLRESLTRYLMLALYRTGRRAEALGAYARTRARLVTELGVEPDPELRELQVQILQDGSGVRRELVGRPAAAGPPAAVPRQLPPVSLGFTGRAAQRSRLRDRLTSVQVGRSARAVVVAVHGPAGVGKSTLGTRVAHDVAALFPDGQLYLDVHGCTAGLPPLTPFDVLSRCLRGLGLRDVEIPADETEAAACLRSITADRRVLLFLDNVADPRQMQSVIPANPACAVIITSRVPGARAEANLSMELDVLSPAEAVALLGQIAGQPATDRSAFEAVARYCDYLPLALCLAGARMDREPELSPARLAAELADYRNRLDSLELNGVGVRSCIRVGYDELAGGRGPAGRVAAAAFCALGLIQVPTVTTALVAAMVCPDNVTLAADALARLAWAQLVLVAGDGRYRTHDMVRLVAGECAEEAMSPAERAATVARGIAFHAGCAVLADDLLRPNRQSLYPRPACADLTRADLAAADLRSPADVGPWLDVELPNLVATAHLAATGDDSVALCAVWLADALWRVLQKRGEFHWERALAVSAVAAAERIGDASVHARTLLHLGRSELHLTRNDVAAEVIARSHAIARASGDLAGEVSALNDLGLVAIARGDFRSARDHLLHCLELAKVIPVGAWVSAVVLHNLSIAYVRLGDWHQAETALARGVELRRTCADRAGSGTDLVLLGMVQCKRGLLGQAQKSLQDGVAICQEVGGRVDTWLGQSALVVVHLRQHRYDEAAEAGRRCLALARVIGEPFAESTAHLLLTTALSAGATVHTRLAEEIAAEPVHPDDHVLHAIMADLGWDSPL